MSDLLDLLRALDVADAEIQARLRERGLIPQTIAGCEARMAAAQAAVEAEKAALEEAEKRRRTRERELQDLEAQRTRYQQQTSLVKTNEEYTALLHEIDATERRIGEAEEAILLAMEEADRRADSLRAATERQKQETDELQQQVQAQRARLTEVERQIEARRAERAELLPRLEAPLRASYERVHAKLGTATARIRGRSCAACFRDLPFELVNRVQAGEVHTCGNCARLLVGVLE